MNNRHIFLGNDLSVSQLGLGCMGMSAWYGKTNDIESASVIKRAYELGVNHFDTADCYGDDGHNEIMLGTVLKQFPREKIVIATKCGFKMEGNDISIDNSPEYIKNCCHASLKRLGLDYIDLFYLHRVNPNTPIEVSMEALVKLVEEGKIRNIGLSEVCAETIAKAHKIHQIAAVQNEYSLWSRDAEKEVLPLCKSLGIGFVAFGPTGRGFFSGKLKNLDVLDTDDARRSFPRFQKENLQFNLGLVDFLEKMAIKKSCTTVQIALAFILAQGNNVTAIPGTKRITYLEENVKAPNVTLSREELIELDEKFPINCARGERMSAEFAKFSNN